MGNRTTQTAFLLLFVAAVQAEDLETSHAFNVNFELAPKWSLLLHTRVRTFQDANSFYQARGGPIVTWQALPRLSVLSGYYYIDQNTRLSKAYTLHRMWGGGQYRVINASRWSLDGRGVYERFISEQFLDYNRLRNRASLNVPVTRRMSTYWSGEAMLQQGVWYPRYAAGATWKIGSRTLLGAGYEFRGAVIGPGSHVIATLLQFDGIHGSWHGD